MKYVAVIAVIAIAVIATLPAGAVAQERRTGLIAVFAVTQRNVIDERMQLVVKRIKDRKSRPIGSIGQVCTRLPLSEPERDARQSCVGTLIMPLGRITFAGARRSVGYYVFAVTGGTGAYAGVTGSMSARTITTGPRVEWVLVSLV